MCSEFQSYTTMEEKDIKRKQIEKKLKELLIVKDKLEEHFNFEIEGYIIEDIIENEDYHHFCLMVNLATENNRFTKEQGEILKQGVKELFKIDNDYERLNKAYILGGFNYDEWYKKYHNEEIIDLDKYLNKEDKKILKKLKISLKDKVLTNYEYDVIKGELLEYYLDDDMDTLELSMCKPLDNTGVSRDEYNEVLKKFEKISNENNTF